MKRFQKFIFILPLFIAACIQLSGQTIRFEKSVYPHSKVVFARHYADGIFKLKELTTDSNGFTVIYNDSLQSGIYYLILQDSSNIEILYDSDFKGKITISNSENTLLTNLTGPKPTVLFNNYINSIGNTETTQKINSQTLIDDIIREDNSSFLAAYLKAHLKIIVPKYTPPTEVVNKDSAIWSFRLQYYQKHFLDNLDLEDDRLINTPVYTDKINNYLDKIADKEPKALMQAVDNLILKTKNNPITSQFLINYLLIKYSKNKRDQRSEFIYVNLIRKHYLRSGYKWLQNDQVSYLTEEYSRHLPASLFQIAPNITGKTPNNASQELNDLNNKYTILYFYNYDCSICTHSAPKLKWIKSVYHYMDAEIVAICMGKNDLKWRKYISKNDMKDWVNIHDSGAMGQISSDYNLQYTPTIYVLDKDKRIISKNINVKELENMFFQLALNRNKKP